LTCFMRNPPRRTLSRLKEIHDVVSQISQKIATNPIRKLMKNSVGEIWLDRLPW